MHRFVAAVSPVIVRAALIAFAVLVLVLTPNHAHAQKQSGKQKAIQAIRENSDLHRDLTYASIGRRELKLNLAVPKNVTSPTPLVIWIHGGAWAHGSKDAPTPAAAFLLAGYAVASVEYRLTGEAPFPAQIHDCKAAVRWLRANAGRYNLDPDRFAAWGASAGGHLATLLGTTSGHRELDGNVGDNTGVSSEVQVVCNYFGPLDFPAMLDTASDLPDRLKQAIEQFYGGATPEERRALTELASPLSHVSDGDAPVIIIHGDKDPIVPLSVNRGFPRTLRQHGVPVEMIVLPGAAHGGKEFWNPKLLRQIAAFFDKAW
ncbi:Carboxylesterase NlhH [Maioricimonas rarisocia]|uniref:Carboxylesterase NlhH n=1 Tax=Maioricimonas rarisocia TaxID=2528026 RepID=A0A517Z6Q2_9PLAN|nr:alpha/beta hydrolase [Maioricimonas rarisocia]QDU38101.1 Carboxylesterase NlhH [Maioricimonas rarisocia]